MVADAQPNDEHIHQSTNHMWTQAGCLMNHTGIASKPKMLRTRSHNKVKIRGAPFSMLKQYSSAALIPLTTIKAADASTLDACRVTLWFVFAAMHKESETKA